MLSAYGSIAEYEDVTKRKLIRTKLGVAAGVGHEHVTIHVSSGTTSGAVVLSATVRVPMIGMLDTVQTALSTKLADGALASKALGLSVEGGGNSPSVSQSLYASVRRIFSHLAPPLLLHYSASLPHDPNPDPNRNRNRNPNPNPHPNSAGLPHARNALDRAGSLGATLPLAAGCRRHAAALVGLAAGGALQQHPHAGRCQPYGAGPRRRHP